MTYCNTPLPLRYLQRTGQCAKLWQVNSKLPPLRNRLHLNHRKALEGGSVTRGVPPGAFRTPWGWRRVVSFDSFAAASQRAR